MTEDKAEVRTRLLTQAERDAIQRAGAVSKWIVLVCVPLTVVLVVALIQLARVWAPPLTGPLTLIQNEETMAEALMAVGAMISGMTAVIALSVYLVKAPAAKRVLEKGTAWQISATPVKVQFGRGGWTYRLGDNVFTWLSSVAPASVLEIRTTIDLATSLPLETEAGAGWVLAVNGAPVKKSFWTPWKR